MAPEQCIEAPAPGAGSKEHKASHIIGFPDNKIYSIIRTLSMRLNSLPYAGIVLLFFLLVEDIQRVWMNLKVLAGFPKVVLFLKML